MKKARGEVKRLLRIIGDLQSKVGYARSLHYNDRSQTAFGEAQNILKEAFDLCVKTTSDYDPESYDVFYDKEVK
jgi:hypothetical protein